MVCRGAVVVNLLLPWIRGNHQGIPTEAPPLRPDRGKETPSISVVGAGRDRPSSWPAHYLFENRDPEGTFSTTTLSSCSGSRDAGRFDKKFKRRLAQFSVT